MQHANMEHAETTCFEDIQAMKTWLDRAQAHANRQVPQLRDRLSNIKVFNELLPSNLNCAHLLTQGGLDLQYLQHRYQRGKDWNDEYMRSHRLYVVNEVTSTLSEAHAELLKFQSSQGDGGDSLLDKILRW